MRLLVRSRRPHLRTRVAVAAAASVVVAVIILGGAVQVLLGRHLHAALDATLRDRASGIARLGASAPLLLTSPTVLETSLGPDPLEVEVLDRHGRIVARSLSLGGRTLAAHRLVARAIHAGRDGYADGVVAGQSGRIYVAPLADLSGPASGGAVIVGATTLDIADTLAESRLLIVVSAAFAAALAVPIVFLLTGRALVPLQRLAEAAEVIETRGDAALRLPVDAEDGAAADEVQRLAETLNRMLAALERARDAERRFVADASHELRNPLSALRGNAAFLARHGADSAALADLREDADRLSRLVGDLLALAREDTAELPNEPVRLDELVAAATDDQVHAHVLDPGWVRGDREALRRALENLVENGRRHGPPGGAIEVSVARPSPSWVLLAVKDTGTGIPTALAEQATRRFWRGHAARGARGSGLGLSLVRATAERHGGRLVIDGACFVVELPALTPLSASPDTRHGGTRQGAS